MTTISRCVKPLLLAGFAVTILAIGSAARAQEPTVSSQTGPRLDFPAGLATDSRTVWVANSRNNTVTAIDTTSHGISIVAGETFQEGSNDGIGESARFNSPDGMVLVGRALYVLDTNNSDLRKINLDTRAVATAAGTANIAGTEDGPASAAHFNLPTQVASDAKFVYVTDTGNDVIRKIDLSTLETNTIAVTGEEGVNNGPGDKATFSN